MYLLSFVLELRQQPISKFDKTDLKNPVFPFENY